MAFFSIARFRELFLTAFARGELRFDFGEPLGLADTFGLADAIGEGEAVAVGETFAAGVAFVAGAV